MTLFIVINYNNMSIGARIDLLCKHQQISIVEFSSMIGVGQSIVYKWKREESNPNYSAILSIKTKFPDLDFNWLLFGEGEMFKGEANLTASTSKNLANENSGDTFVANNATKITPMTSEERKQFLQMQQEIANLKDQMKQVLETNSQLVQMLANQSGKNG